MIICHSESCYLRGVSSHDKDRDTSYLQKYGCLACGGGRDCKSFLQRYSPLNPSNRHEAVSGPLPSKQPSPALSQSAPFAFCFAALPWPYGTPIPGLLKNRDPRQVGNQCSWEKVKPWPSLGNCAQECRGWADYHLSSQVGTPGVAH